MKKSKFKIQDRHVQFVNLIAAGKNQADAYLETIAKPGTKKAAASATSSKLLARPEVQDLLIKARGERAKVITEVVQRNIAQEFSTTLLTVEELDAYHSAIIQGKVTIEEVVPAWESIYDKKGNLVSRNQKFVRVQRPPNVKEKQTSIDALYKRRGSYAPNRLLAAVAGVDKDGNLEDNADRVVVLSDGTTIPLAAIVQKT